MRRIRTVLGLVPLLGLGASSCRNPGEPWSDNWAKSAFGSAVVWVAYDSVGTWGLDPVLDGNRVYYLRRPRLGITEQIESPRVVAVGTELGDVQWSTNVQFARNLAVAGPFVAGAAAALEVLDRATGAPRATQPLEPRPFGAQIATDGTRFYALTDSSGRVVAYDPAAESVVWETSVGVAFKNSAVGPVVAGDRVIAVFRYAWPTDSMIVAALDRNTGAVLWRFATPGTASTPPVVIDGQAIVVTWAHDVIALSLETGAKNWQVDAGDGFRNYVYDGLAACDGRVIVPTGSSRIRALSSQNGATLWTSDKLSFGSNVTVQCSHGTVMAYIGDLRILRASDGTSLARYPLKGNAEFIHRATRDAQYLYLAGRFGLVKIKAP